jgi:hypothetical protein
MQSITSWSDAEGRLEEFCALASSVFIDILDSLHDRTNRGSQKVRQEEGKRLGGERRRGDSLCCRNQQGTAAVAMG